MSRGEGRCINSRWKLEPARETLPSKKRNTSRFELSSGIQNAMVNFDVTLCGQCSTCLIYFPCEQLFSLQIQRDNTPQDTGRLICFKCQREMMNHRAYRVRELSRQEIDSAMQQWLIQRNLLPKSSTSRYRTTFAFSGFSPKGHAR